jgi:hypothetical protein
MKLDVIGLVDVVSAPQTIDVVVIDKVNEATTTVYNVKKEVDIKLEEVQIKIDNIEKGYIDWIES